MTSTPSASPPASEQPAVETTSAQPRLRRPAEVPIAAVATAPGRGGIGVVRVSGPDVGPVMRAICGQ